MRILIIEDTEYKAKSIQRFLADVTPESEIQVAKSFQSAKRSLKTFSPDVVLLDMTIQTSERPDGQTDGRNRMYGGKDILSEMDFMEMQARVIVITQYDHFGEAPHSIDLATLFKELKAKFPKLFMGGVYYNNINSEWQVELRRLLKTVA